MATNVADDDKVRLAEFPRKNRETGGREAIRVELADFQGHEYLHVRLWFEPRGGGELRPTKTGVAIREHELDDLAAAIEEARRLVHAQGRATSSGQDAPRSPADLKSRRDRPRHFPGRPAPAAPPWDDQDDETPY